MDVIGEVCLVPQVDAVTIDSASVRNRCLIKCWPAQSYGNKPGIVYIGHQPTLSPVHWLMFHFQPAGFSYLTSLYISSLGCTGRAARSGHSISLSIPRSSHCKDYSVLLVLYALVLNRRSVSAPLSFPTCAYFLLHAMRLSYISQCHLHGLHDSGTINETLAFLDCK
jgi:hypothetical protein